MVRLLIEPRDDDRIEAHARRLLTEHASKSKDPMGVAVTRALVPTWCASCDERCWGPAQYAMCAKCKGEGKQPVGFSA